MANAEANDVNHSNPTFHSIPLHLIEISIGQFLLPYERQKIKRLSTYYQNLFNLKSTISILNSKPSSSLSVINIETFWNVINYLQNHIIQKYFIDNQNKLSFTHQTFDNLPNDHYFMLKYLLIYYKDIKNHESTITTLAFENGKDVQWSNLFNMLPQVTYINIKVHLYCI